MRKSGLEAEQRPAAIWPPPKEKPLRLIIDTDAANEIDDQYALALALGFPERLTIEALVAAHFGSKGGGAAGIEKSYDEIIRVLEKAGLHGTLPVHRGADRFSSEKIPTAAGVEFIIERALSATPDEPLWLVLLGPATNGVAALLREPKITDRLIVFWHVRSEWPTRCRNFNATNDPNATRRLLETPSRLVLFDTGTHLELSAGEAARRCGGVGALGQYLAAIHRAQYPDNPKGLFDLGDIAALVDPDCVAWEQTPVPGVDADLGYDFSQTFGSAVRAFTRWIRRARSRCWTKRCTNYPRLFDEQHLLVGGKRPQLVGNRALERIGCGPNRAHRRKNLVSEVQSVNQQVLAPFVR